MAVWLFGSAARADGSSGSDLDVLVVRPDELPDDDPTWRSQVASFAEQAGRWSGNSCEIIELSRTELALMAQSGERLVSEARADAITLAGSSPRQLLSAQALLS